MNKRRKKSKQKVIHTPARLRYLCLPPAVLRNPISYLKAACLAFLGVRRERRSSDRRSLICFCGRTFLFYFILFVFFVFPPRAIVFSYVTLWLGDIVMISSGLASVWERGHRFGKPVSAQSRSAQLFTSQLSLLRIPRKTEACTEASNTGELRCRL